MIEKILVLLFGASSWQEIRERGLKMAILIPAMHWIDWLMVAATASVVLALKQAHYSTMSIFFILWVGNMILSGAIVWLNDVSRADVLLMEALRRGVNLLIQKYPYFGYLVEGLLIIRLVFWDGPDNFILFFRERLRSRLQKVGVFIFVSGLQMAVWTMIYVAGITVFEGWLSV